MNSWELRLRRSTQNYDVADLIGATNSQKQLQDFGTLIDLITSTVTPQDWESNGGNAAVEGFPTQLSLVVPHSNEGHIALAKFPEELREKIRLAKR